MNAKTQQTTQRGSGPDSARQDGAYQHHDGQPGPGVDLPLLGHVEYTSAGFLAGLGIAGVVGAIEWPVAVAVGVGYALARRERE